jgi:hypothetical protein
LSGLSREVAAERVLWSLGMRGTPIQVKILIYVLGCKRGFSESELIRECDLTRNYVRYFISSMLSRGIFVPVPRPVEPVDWAETYGISVRRRKRREQNFLTPTLLSLDWARLRSLVLERCDDLKVLEMLEASGK